MAFVQTYKKYLVTTLLIWTVVSVFCLIAFLLILSPQRDRISLDAQKTEEKKNLYESALTAAQKDTRNKLTEQLNHIRDRVGNFLVDFEASTDLTFDVSQIANEKDVDSFSIKNISSKGFVSIPNCEYIYENQFNINFNSGFNQFAAFLNALERHQPVLFVDQFKIDQSRKVDSGYQVTLNVSFFVKKPQNSEKTTKDSV
jgi:Tfp pilus assembly protein PilO